MVAPWALRAMAGVAHPSVAPWALRAVAEVVRPLVALWAQGDMAADHPAGGGKDCMSLTRGEATHYGCAGMTTR